MSVPSVLSTARLAIVPGRLLPVPPVTLAAPVRAVAAASSIYDDANSRRLPHSFFCPGTGRIVAATLTSKDVDDASPAGPLLDQFAGAVASFTGDGAYDQDRVYNDVTQRHPDAAVVVPPRATAVPSDTAETAPTQRDRHIQHIAEHGRMAWQNASGYNRRARVEATMNRWKQVMDDELRAHTDERRATEVAVAVHARSTACWISDAQATSASSDPRRGWGQCARTPDPCTTLAHHVKPV